MVFDYRMRPGVVEKSNALALMRAVRPLPTRYCSCSNGARHARSIAEMVRMLDLEHYDRKQIKAALEVAVVRRTLRRIGKTRYQWVREVDRAAAPARTSGARSRRHESHGPAVEGHYSRVRAGYGFVEVLGRAAERFPRDILIPAGMEGEALHGDRVAVEIIRRDLRARRFVGRISAVTGPVHEKIIGTLSAIAAAGCWYRRVSCCHRWRSSVANRLGRRMPDK